MARRASRAAVDGLAWGQQAPWPKAASDESPGTGTIRNQLETGCWALAEVATDRIEPEPLPGVPSTGQ